MVTRNTAAAHATAFRNPAIAQGPASRTSRFNAANGNSHFIQNHATNAAVARHTNFNGTRYNAAFNRSNRYGGRWFAANAHPGWNRGREYYWNNHYYRWFDNGWLIVDAGLWPYGYPYGYPYYAYDDGNYYDNQPAYADNSTAADVQSKLAQLGYYNGDVDGVIGPLSRQAIENYQADQGLPVSGVIDQQLLDSLGLS